MALDILSESYGRHSEVGSLTESFREVTPVVVNLTTELQKDSLWLRGYIKLLSVRQGVHDVIDTHADRAGAFFQRHVALIEIFPEVADIVVVVGDELKAAVLVGHSPKLRNKVSVRSLHVEVI